MLINAATTLNTSTLVWNNIAITGNTTVTLGAALNAKIITMREGSIAFA
jgi:hypothetical protein